MDRQENEQIVAWFQRLCEAPESTWEPELSSSELREHAQREVLGLLRAQSRPCPLLDQSFLETFPNLASQGAAPFDGFEIIRKIGSGGMGLVYLAEDTELHRMVAIKVLPAVLTASGSGVERFRREAQTVSKLDHPHIVPVHRFGRWEKTHYIASAYIEGETLALALGCIDYTGAPDLRRINAALGAVHSIAQALDYAHRNGVIHRDVKPSNILIDTNGKAHLCDFGIAKVEHSHDLTMTHEVPGTSGYMSPEQEGLIASPLDARSDVYSLGAVLYECATGRRWCVSAKNGDPRQPANPQLGVLSRKNTVPHAADLAAICQKALEWEPARRYQSAGEFAGDLDRFLRGQPIAARRASLARRGVWAARRRPVVTTATATLLIAASSLVSLRAFTAPPTTALVTIAPVSAISAIEHRAFDPATQMFENPELIPSGRHSFRLEPGLHRIAVDTPEGLREFTRRIEAGETTTIRIPASAPATTGGMILIPAGEATVGNPFVEDPIHGHRTIDLAAYWIDRHEVTNAEFRGYVEATGASPPQIWTDPYDIAIDSLPVVGVTYDEARSYAEWLGKRLPTKPEWERAARGSEGRLYPWGDEPITDERPANVGVSIVGLTTQDLRSPEVRSAVLASLVNAEVPFGRDITPEGGLDYYGNAAELTDTPFVQMSAGGAIELPGQQIAMGRSWKDKADNAPLYMMILAPQDQAMSVVGFRCARSARP
ncbi:MAG: SUMF1/EgtB/PvdO family nonheme iron enzyme [Phycisphaeraceae bacterium]|nr:SUMF1/EgtB/PvdO family nonheme iron enzyme [Phycisphaeraceae bacterium]